METSYLPNSVMLETLAKVQPMQMEIVKTGRSAHLDCGVHSVDGHISFDLTVFCDLEIVRQFEFSSLGTAGELEEELACLEAYVKRIKAEM
ncbi:MAG: hypothetical protein J6W09_11315 [Bacteroidales bacterium]|nr:hypothetical protein [Bacteroidales bacterium]